jgi:hypothetical protein
MTFFYTSSFNVSVDNSTPIQFFLYRSGSPPLYNFTAYDEQFLQSGNHILDLMELDTNDTADSPHNSNFLFDFVVINETMPFPDATPSVAPAATTTSSIPGATTGTLPSTTSTQPTR